MMKKNVLSLSLLCVLSLAVKAQDPVVMTINDKPVTKSEFEAVFNKNNNKEKTDAKSVKEYADLYTLFKMKVLEAESMGLDTLMSFKNELNGYRKQLAAPYLTDKNTNENLLTEAYERLKVEVKASHILIRCDESYLPKDTLEAWTRANLIRNAILGKLPTNAQIAEYDKLLKNTTETLSLFRRKDSAIYKIKINAIKNLATNVTKNPDRFAALAPVTSDDASVADNRGDLGYFTSMDMVYPFENGAYNTKVGEVSTIVKSRFGYHILKVYEKRNSRGEILVSHIMVKIPKGGTEQDKANSKAKAKELFDKVKAGEKFEDVARQFSDDKQTSDQGGQLQPFKSGRFPKSFEDAAFGLKNNGDISEPVETQYGWHIIKRIDKKALPPFAEMKNDLKAKVSRDTRSQMGKVALIARVKKNNGFKENLKARDEFKTIIDSTYLQATWTTKRAQSLGNKEMFNIGGRSYTQNQFAKYLETQMTIRTQDDAWEVAKPMYTKWVDECVVAFEDSQLEKNYVEFRNLVREYREGILLFDLTDQKVWSKAVKDTTGLKKYYEDHKASYQWDERADVTNYKCVNEVIAKDVRKMLASKKTDKEILEVANKTSQLNLSIENIFYLKNERPIINENWKAGIIAKDFEDPNEKKTVVIVVNKILPVSPKTLPECRGMVTADYQNHLETEWLNYLKGKYKVTINEDVLKTIK
ncbi:MAG: peptidylprolyl isomerase [Sphingobacteriaceae bacterium]|nr:peptidylprolyl isomerase [Sphingobacteriaceae bacterium]